MEPGGQLWVWRPETSFCGGGACGGACVGLKVRRPHPRTLGHHNFQTSGVRDLVLRILGTRLYSTVLVRKIQSQF